MRRRRTIKAKWVYQRRVWRDAFFDSLCSIGEILWAIQVLAPGFIVLLVLFSFTSIHFGYVENSAAGFVAAFYDLLCSIGTTFKFAALPGFIALIFWCRLAGRQIYIDLD